MIGPDEARARASIAADCAAAIGMLGHETSRWLQLHALPPRRITLARKTDGGSTEDFWLVTDHTGSDDASFRIVYDDVAARYGLECAIGNDVPLFAGFRASLIDAVTDIRYLK